MKYYNPQTFIIQYLPCKEKVKNIEVNRMRKGYIIDMLTSVGNCENFKLSGKVFEIYEAVVHRKNFKKTRFRKVFDELFDLRQKYKDQNNVFLQCLVKLVVKSSYGVQKRRHINHSNYCKADHWMKTEYDENVLDYLKLPKGKYFVKMKKTTD